MFDEESKQIHDYLRRLTELQVALNLESVQQDIVRVEGEMSAPKFWDDPESAQKTVQRLKGLKAVATTPQELQVEMDDAQVLVELAQSENEESLAGEIRETLGHISEKLTRLEISCLFSDPRDSKNAIVSIHPGAGGTESCDWASMLYRMLTRCCERHEYDIEVLEYQPGDEAGIKSVTIRVVGPSAYGNLKSENGVHRLVRISPFDANKRRHTSFAAVEVLTEVDGDIEIDVRDEDLKMDVFRASGAGGQHVNKTSSAVRLTHMPTGIVVACQAERSQHRNRNRAIDMLKAKLYAIEERKKQDELDAQRGTQKDVAWGSQIRNYVLHPYQMIKDLRTNVETGNVEKVLDGDLDAFIEGYLKWNLKRSRN